MTWHRIDYDAIWASDKLASCADWAQAEYTWLYGLTDAHGCFEFTNLRVVWGRVGAIRKSFPIERLDQVLNEFHDRGLLFVWREGGKTYGYVTGCEARLPPHSHRKRYARSTPVPPESELQDYIHMFSANCGVEVPDVQPPAPTIQEGSRTHPDVSGRSPDLSGRLPANVTERSGTEQNGNEHLSALKPRRARAAKQSPELSEEFLNFYQAYPKKRARREAGFAWAKIDPADYPAIMAAVERFKRTGEWLRDGGRYIPNPATFLNGERWKDEISEGRPNGNDSGNRKAGGAITPAAGKYDGRKSAVRVN